MSAWSRLKKDFPDTAVIFAVQNVDSEAEAAAAACGGKAGGVQVLLDPGGRTAKRFNALWLPRAVTIDPQGAITYVQPATTLDPQAPLEAIALWRHNR